MKRHLPPPQDYQLTFHPTTSSIPPTTSSSSLSSTSTTSSLCCFTTHEQHHPTTTTPLEQSINLSLKRVKISTSPGELRLSKDLDDLFTELHWTPNNNNNITSPNRKITLEKDPVDPLRIRIRVIHHADEEWTFCLSIPKMYPHSPPFVYRISKYETTTTATTTTSTTFPCFQSIPPPPLSYDENDDDTSQPFISSNIHYHLHRPPHLEKIIISNSYFPSADSSTTMTTSIAVYDNWSPVSRLHDLILWLSELPERYSSRKKKIHHQWDDECEVVEEEEDALMDDVSAKRKNECRFPENRFDVGFPKQRSKKSPNPSRRVSQW